MKPFTILLFIIIFATHSKAQTPKANGVYDRAEIEYVDIGWMKSFKEDPAVKPIVQNGWNYPALQLDISQKLTSWLFQTYTPRGLLGEIKKSIYAPEAPQTNTSSSYDFNEAEKNNRNALPNTYGTIAIMDALVVKTDKQKFAPMYGNRAMRYWNIMANNVQLISNQVIAISSPDEYYCVMPRYALGMQGEFDKEWNAENAKFRDFITSPNLEKYEHYYIPGKAILGGSDYYVVILTENREPLPFEQVTVAEFIDRMEKQLPQMYKIQINSGSKDIDLLQRAKRGLGYFKEQYKNRLNEYVYLDANPQINLFDFTDADPGKDFPWFKTNASVQENSAYVSTNFPLLRLKKGVKQALANGQPHWIVCRLDGAIAKSHGGEIHLMDHFVNHFNYDYVYNYFFEKERVSTPYTPINFVSAEAKNNSQASTDLSELSKKMNADKSVIYFEDFSTTALKSKPANWTTQLSENTGASVQVVQVNDVEGKWLKLKRYAAPDNFPFPLTGDFSISFDLLVAKGDVPWGTPGVVFELFSGGVPAGEPGKKINDKNPSHKFSIDVSPGNMNQQNAAGWVMIGQNMPEGYNDCKRESYYSLPDFTGYKNANRITMTIQRKGTSVTVLSNDNKVYSCAKTFPESMSFQNIRFYVNEKNTYHISNILVKKL